MMEIRVEALAEADWQAWQDFLALHPGASPYHHPGWLMACEEAYGHRGWVLSVYRDRALIGLLPVCQLRRPGRDALVALPFCDLGGPLTLTDEAGSGLSEAARILMEQLELNRLQVRSSTPSPLREAPPAELEQAPQKVSMRAPLPSSAEALAAGFGSKLRSQIRRAEKNGLTVHVSRGEEAISEFYPVFAENMQRLGSPVHARNWFRAVQSHYDARCVVGVVRYARQPVAVALMLWLGRKACIPWASTRVAFNPLAPNMLLYERLLREAVACGCDEMDFGRSTPGEGTCRFKQQWGARAYPLNWTDWYVDGATADVGQSDPGIWARHGRTWAERCWQRLPLPIANRLGPLLRRNISL